MENYSNLIEAIAGLKKQGYTEDFNLKKNAIIPGSGTYEIFHDEFVIDKYFRFEGDTDPGEQSIIYAIHSLKYNIKGILINAYGIYAESLSNEMIGKLHFNKEV